MDSALVAYSGGVDSSLVAFLAAEVLGAKALAVTSGSASLKRSDLSLAKRLAEEWGMRHRVIVTDELSKPDYRANPVNRCFHCKTSLYTALADIARQEGFTEILNGTNTDDLGDHRPGLIAAEDFAVRSPLVEAGVDKAGVRALAAHLGLDNADKPQSACLSSRFPYGASINAERLAQVERAEECLARLGFVEFRVRHHEDVARLEIGAGELGRALELRDTLQAEIQACGYRFVALDLGAFRSGSLNEGIINAVNIK
ncbi:MAG: ATP-dependent sacrificial sulfur transferase LarE [Gammaproteobacteria bacterium]|nr:ATP-dependent sacrificial sulfur transferase LarE [Gammaproteobacteria bacterium]MYE52115.1 ATP-dependent sacrificial sulfur transferase LarE [Gammaproteobacteria bacterium]MYF48989.1 ATP-dependent sacrificial sulfur transferase LarE [Gammaproteobacteria bacterium]